MCIQEARKKNNLKEKRSNIKGKRNAKGLHNLARWKVSKVAVLKSFFKALGFAVVHRALRDILECVLQK